ncbi:MAG TPA: ABC transporter ATP-binding protein, partial [Armatimonadota bacterium]|nr:ABC transporter ATP-binding protein [Armatimonadota bacterium]
MDSAFLQSCHIVVHQAGKYYPGHGGGEGLWAVRDLTLCARPGEFAAVVGPSGCGKSTLLSLLAGFEQATEGKVMLEGRPVSGPGPDRGVVFQEDALFPWLTVLGNVCYGLHRRGVSRPEARDEAMRFLHLVGLEEFADYYPSQLSGGMRQRVALARVLANRPRALLMDEPFGALDALTRMEMQQLLLDVWQKLNVTVLFVTHDGEPLFYRHWPATG